MQNMQGIHFASEKSDCDFNPSIWLKIFKYARVSPSNWLEYFDKNVQPTVYK